MSKSPHTPEWRAMVAQAYLDGSGSSYELATKYGIHAKTIRRWAACYREHGIMTFLHHGNKSYRSDFKIMCVELYITGQMSIDDIVAKFDISNWCVLNSWIKMYNANRELKDYDPKREVYMADARRKTSIEERIEIVEYCLKHNQDYKGTASRYHVSYNQVYSWVKKYNANGKEGLADHRGHHKADEDVDQLEQLRRENLRLKRQLKESDMVVELLKKVKELEGM